MQQVRIVVKGQIDQGWSDWFGGFEVTQAAGGSTLTGPVRDQAELRGILSRLADLGLELISVNPLSAQSAREKQATGGGEGEAKKSGPGK